MSFEHHLSGTHRRIFRRVLIATPKRGAEFVARVTGTSRSRKGPTVRFRDRRNCIFRDTISDITRVTPYWYRNEELEKRGLPQVLLEEIKKKKKSVRTGIYSYSLLRFFLSLKAKVGSSRFFHLLVHTFALYFLKCSFTKLLLDSIQIDLTLIALSAIRIEASEAFIRSHSTVTLKINCPPSERYSRNFTTFTGLKNLSR